MSVDHYENFPVASLLCPPKLRPAVRAVYAYARTADDIADEGDAPARQRLDHLAAYRHELARAARGEPATRWPAVFGPLSRALREHRLPVELLGALLDAFEQDVVQQRYRDRAELLDYCRRSADSVGRLLLHLYRLDDAASLRQSDAVCTALQLANFWQDLGVDAARGRLYLPEADCRRHGIDPEALVLTRTDDHRVRAAVAEMCAWTRQLMHSGAPLVHTIGGSAGFELRLVVQGGLRIVEKIERLGCATMSKRPTIGARDALPIFWRALRMPRRAARCAGEAA